jgi:phosphinothricin acetyltransferase
MPQIRPATEADLPAILAIYNDAVTKTTAIWNEAPSDLGSRQVWFAERRQAGFPVLVADDEGKVLGYGSFGEFRPFDGYRLTVEHSVYVLDEAQGRGIGKMLLKALIAEARTLGKRVMVGAIDASNYASLALHDTMGFEERGRMPGVGEKFGKRLDLVLVQLTLQS